MHALLRSPLLPAAALLLAAPWTLAQAPLPDPVAPAVIGRPLDQLAPARPKAAPAKPAAAKASPAPQVAASPAAKPTAPVVAAAPAVATAPAAVPVSVAPSAAPSTQRTAKPAVDDRADPRMQLDDVGKGTNFARKPLGEGAYFGERHRNAARRFYDANPVMRPAVKWKIGEPVPAGAVVAMVPRGLLAALPPVPPGHAYVELGGEVVLVASESRMVVDGISRPSAGTAVVSR